MADNASGTQLLEMYRRMRLIRDFEELVQALFLKGEVHGTTHLYIGQEADAVGVASVLGEEDRLAGTYRGPRCRAGPGRRPAGAAATRCSAAPPASAAGAPDR